ncbi:glycoside hydrolase family 2 protein [Neobacillus dielmonensis]|uniref:glycoside hydrolase family 2 protein n=1 Tax=Neobacillus dielmonensis TaxID=1347369 RepID=UPI0005A9C07C|nr:glycoside hydrolase family 2 [Neobacillus dielmonensis]
MFETHKKGVRNRLSLNGTWHILLDPEDKLLPGDIFNHKGNSQINIPGSWEEQGFGQPSKHNPIGAWKKEREYVGTAWYSRKIYISEEMKDQSIKLVLRGVRWITRVYINNQLAGEGESLISDHVFDLTNYLTFGQANEIVIYVNNEMRYPLHESHIHSYHTATNWGGITGGAFLETTHKTSIETVKYQSDLENQKVEFEIEIKNSARLEHDSFLAFNIYTGAEKLEVQHIEPLALTKSKMTVSLPFWDEVHYWDDDHPYLYKVTVDLIESETIVDQFELSVGIRKIETKGKTFLINNQPTFLRGYVDCCIFPQTGYPSWDKEHYRNQFKTVKEYGFNHVRLHGWTPPKPFWDAADEEGMLVQTELPHWSFFYKERGKEPNSEVHQFLTRELKRIIDTLQVHPSFVLLSLGNELISAEGHEALNELVRLCRTLDPTRLYTDNTGFGHLPPNDREGDYFIPTLNHHKPITIDYAGTPNTYEDYHMITMQASKPLIGHEHGQFTMYVRPEEQDKYKGILQPHWLKTTMETLEKKNLLNRMHDYIAASGKLQARAYKENIERARRTSGLAGIQLLDIRDFPGQGHATTGVLDVFWDNKGTITPEEFRAFNDDAVLLMRSFERTLYAGERLQVDIDLSNYSKFDFAGCTLQWEVVTGQAVYQTGAIIIPEAKSGEITSLGRIQVATPADESLPLTLKVMLRSEEKTLKNEWEFWTYKRAVLHKESKRIWTDVQELRTSLFGAKFAGKIGFDGFSYKGAKDIDLAVSDHLSPELLQFLLDGGKAWIIAKEGNQFDEVKTRFLPIFWNYVWFPSQVGTTMGMIIHDHPSLKNYPHDGTSNWNWFYLVDRAVALNLDTVPQVEPIVEVIDNHNRGKHLTYSYEVNIGEGKLFVTSFNILPYLKRPEAEALLHQYINYLMSEKFTPTSTLTVGELLGLFKLQGTW